MLSYPDATLRRRSVLLAGATTFMPTFGIAQPTFPSRPVHLVLPQPPGGAADRLARTLGQRLGERWKQSVIIDNRPGGGVVVGTLAVVHAEPDGYTIGLLGSSLSINAVQRNDLPYSVNDLTPIARIGYYTMTLIARSDFPANDVKGLVELARRNPPNMFSFGSNGVGTSAEVAGEMLNHMAGVELQHVPYNGATKMYTDMLGGRLPLGFSVASSAASFIKQGKLKVLGVTSAKPSPLYPDWPAIAQTLPGFDIVNWAGVCGPVRLAPSLVDTLSSSILAVLQRPDMQSDMEGMGMEYEPQGSKAFGEFILSEMKRFAIITKPLSKRTG